MRLFEILLLCANLLTLIFAVRPVSKSIWLGVAGVNLVVLLIHGIAEGFRYQMAFSYAFVGLVVLSAAAQASGRLPKVRIPNAIKFLGIGLSVVLIAISAILAYAFPIFMLPKPTGTNAVGVQYLRLVDENRADPFRDKLPQKRKLMVKVYYPATPDDTKPFSPYFHGSTRLLRAFAGFYQMPRFLFDHLKRVKTYTKDNLPVSEEQPTYPVVLFSHGAGATMEVSTSQCEDLASHGYIVAAIDHPYVSSATEFPEGIVSAHEATTNFDTPEPAEPITQIMAEDDRFVIDRLAAMNSGAIAPAFQGKLNLDAIGVIGHSVGGAVAYNLAINDRRVKAAINLDGVVYITPKTTKGMAPFLMLANDRFHIQAIEKRESLLKKLDSTDAAAYNRAQRNIKGLASVLKTSGNLYTIEGSDHMKFTDIGLFIGSPWLRELLQIGGKTDPSRCLEITQALTVAFFDHHLKGERGEVLRTVANTFPELKKVILE